MTNYRHPEHKATETVTFRLTRDERHLLDYLARLEGKTLTDFVRGLLTKRAAELEIKEVPAPPPRRRPGRPKKPRPNQKAPEVSSAKIFSPPRPSLSTDEGELRAPRPEPVRETEADMDPQIPVTIVPPEPQELTLGDIIARFRKSFSHRAEGTKKEFEDTIAFFCGDDHGFPLLDVNLPVSRLSSTLLAEVREEMKPLNLRVAKKNLHLTYLRMMLHWAVKEPEIGLVANPALPLTSFTISEIPESWPGKSY